MVEERNKLANKTLDELSDLMAGCAPNSLQDQAVRAEFLRRQTQAQIDAASATIKSAYGVLATVAVAVIALLVSIFFKISD
jgi:hypothetical protein